MVKKQKTAKGMTLLLAIMFIVSIFEVILIPSAFAQGVSDAEQVGVAESTVCCEKTNSGLFCQNVRADQCASERQPKTSCESTSFCNPGYCSDSTEGTCLDNVPEIVCKTNGGTWWAEKPAQCNLGCCTLNDQASFSTLVRCKRLSSFYGLETNWDADVTDETQCVLSAGLKEKGACVYEKDFEKTCTLTTKEECTADIIEGGPSADVINSDRNLEGLTPSGGTATPMGAGSDATAAATTTPASTTADTETAAVSTSPEDGVTFYPGKLCSAEELGTNCGPTKQTICVPGKEEVYFVDTCGNPANIYDSTKATNKEYWANLKDKSEVCNPDSGNGDNPNCGNCNYLYGSYCRAASSETAQPKLGNNICQSLNCINDEGEEKLHGESWCVYDDKGHNFQPEDYPGTVGNAIGNNVANDINSKLAALVDGSVSSLKGGKGLGTTLLSSSGGDVGSRFYRQICINGEIKTEPCSDFRQEECLENSIQTPQGEFSEAACRVNRWQDCTAQRDLQDCLNTDRRDCTWLEGIQYILMGAVLNGTSVSDNNLASVKESVKAQGGLDNIPQGACVPKIPPGLRFWQGEEAQTICAQANALCPVTYEKGLLDDEWECKENCACDPDSNPQILAQRAQVCMAMGDCGPKVNYVGQKGYTKGYEVKTKKLNKDKDD